MTTTDDITSISNLIDSTYPAGLDPEAAMWRRCVKVTEESGEVTEALLGMIGENPRKGFSHDLDAVIHELLDTALAAMGACVHLRPGFDPVEALGHHAATRLTRLRQAINTAEEGLSHDQ